MRKLLVVMYHFYASLSHDKRQHVFQIAVYWTGPFLLTRDLKERSAAGLGNRGLSYLDNNIHHRNDWYFLGCNKISFKNMVKTTCLNSWHLM